MIRLSMDQIATYQIRIPGEFPADWLNCEASMEIEVEFVADKLSSTTITGKLDQAALMGLLRRIYNLGLPLISVEWVDFKDKADR